MPSTSAKQAKFMKAVASNPKFAKKVGVPQSVGKEYEMADKKTKKYRDGGATIAEPKGFKRLMRFDLDKVRKDTTARDNAAKERSYRRALGSDAQINARANRSQAMEADEARLMGVGRKAKGGKVMKKSDKAGRALVKKSADTMGRAMMKKAGGGKCYAKGGSVSARADGVAKKGKTHTKMVAMRKGGSC